MAIFRIQHNDFEKIFNANLPDTLIIDEWKDQDADRLKESGWDNRYEYESQLIKELVDGSTIKTILEVGSGPGILSQKIQTKFPPVEYHLVDKPYAKEYFINHNFKGNFFIKDVSLDLDTTGLLKCYDLIICNDTLEHLLAPSNIITKFKSLMNKNSFLFVSIPNWRMAHQFIYRGLWDYDNISYFLYCHGFNIESVSPSILKTPFYPKLSSEESMPDELLQSWNYYFMCKLR